jgi:hypothetical protein
MKTRKIVIAAASLFLSTVSAGALTITDAKIEGGKLVVLGRTNSANQQVTLDGEFTARSNGQKRFDFRLGNYHPADCVVRVTAGAANDSGVVANCGQRGLSPQGTWDADKRYVQNDLVTWQGSSWRARQGHRGREPGASRIWELFAAKGQAGVQGPAGPPGTVGAATVQYEIAAADLPLNTSASYDVTCPVGMQGIAGGFRGDTTDSEYTITSSSRPLRAGGAFPIDNQNFIGWRVTVRRVASPRGGIPGQPT